MKKEEVLKIIADAQKLDEMLVFVGSTAYHQLGDISREPLDKQGKFPEYFYAYSSTEDYFVGNWVEGYGFVNVVFPKNSSRVLTDEELDKFNNMRFVIQ